MTVPRLPIVATYNANLKNVKKIMKNSIPVRPSAVYEINSLLYIKFRLERGAWEPLGGCLSHRQSPCGLRFVRAKG